MWFWHGFPAANEDGFEDPELLPAQLLTFRGYWTGRFDDLLRLMASNLVVLLGPDSELSVFGSPHETYARGLMELFSLDVDGGCTRRDAAEVGAALPGYTLDVGASPTRARVPLALNDNDEKPVLGQTCRSTGDDAVDIARWSECNRITASRFWTGCAETDPSDEVRDEVGQIDDHQPRCGRWPSIEPWIDDTRSIGRLDAATRQGSGRVRHRVLPDPSDRRRARPARSRLAADCGVRARRVVLRGRHRHRAQRPSGGDRQRRQPLSSAIAIAFTSPEVAPS